MTQNFRQILATSCSLVAMFTMTPSIASETTEQNRPNASDGYGLQDIVVTAQRREESLQDVPVAVTAINSDTLAQMRVANVGNLSGAAPNLQISLQGIQSTPIISIRGVTGGSSNNGVDPKVGIYLNGVYVGRSVGAVFDLADIERIEVLRGPQGTLFGRNATSGALSLVTSPPKGEFGVKQDLSYGNYDAFRSRTILNLPAVGPLSVKASYLHDEMRGDVTNLLAGETIDFALREPSFGKLKFVDRLGSRNVDAVQVAARLDLDNVTIDYNFDWTDMRSSSRAVQQLGPINDGLGYLVQALNGYQPYIGGITNQSARPLKQVANAISQEHVTVQGHNVTLAWNVSDAVTFKSITALRKMKQRPNIHDLAATGGTVFDLTNLLVFLVEPPAVPNLEDINLSTINPNERIYSLLTARSTSQKQFTQEFQVQVSQDHFDLVAGAFYFREKSPALDVLGVMQEVTNGVVIPNFLDGQFGSGVTESVTKNNSIAFYGQGTIPVSDTVDISLGLRYTEDKRQTNLMRISAAQGGDLEPGIYKSNYSKMTYTAIVNWKPTADVTAYAKIASGYNAGGIMSGMPYDPENLTSYELGLKSSFADNRVRFNGALFFMDYKDLQTQTFNNGVQSFQNAGKAKAKGIEMELDVVPARGLTLSGSLGYTDFDYKEYIINGTDVADVARPPYFASWTGRATAHWDFAELSGGATPFIRAEGRYRSKSYLTATPLLPVETEKLNTTPAYWLVDGRLGISDISMGGTKVNLSGWVKNVFDKRVADWGASAGPLNGIFNWGRTYGVDLGLAF